ncbi:IS66 family insertion sequence element accessory protein TnpB [Agrobacterium sp. Ap1]|uniref:IS66 family insertion sequence element accessory protein TnpB n=1 Tax=Agrobacterium sp. Ap1 TaxID=2815337 RepID=UPI001A8F3A65|nr:IS66 family insertion sequence element accessory protein TnpB [Agrobacterium sp. Ap1]
MMILPPSGGKVWLETGHTDMRTVFPGLWLMVQEALKRDPMCGHFSYSVTEAAARSPVCLRGRWSVDASSSH